MPAKDPALSWKSAGPDTKGAERVAKVLDVPIEDLGRTEETRAIADVEPLFRLAAVLEADWPLNPGEPVPAGWHCAYFLPATPQSRLGAEGHASGVGLLPPLTGLRRMWAGSRFAFEGSLRIGSAMMRRSRILGLERKTGRGGPFLLLHLEHVIEGEQGGLIREGQDLIFRPPLADVEGGRPRRPAEKPQAADFERELKPDPVLLFRFSAVTFNAHRIHYDHPYATAVEGYGGLVVHGPLQALLMLDLMHRTRPDQRIASFNFRAEQPALLPAALRIRGRAEDAGFNLWIEQEGRVVSRGRVEAAGPPQPLLG
jgi:3-methylfumaryl-CoA hydratase